MENGGRVALSILTGFVVAIVIASACVVAYTQYHRATSAESALARTQDKLTDTGLALQSTKFTLDDTQNDLIEATGVLTQTQATLKTTQGQLATATAQQTSASTVASRCRLMVPVNDHLLDALVKQSNATGFLMKRNRTGARRAILRAQQQVRYVQRLVHRSGFRNLDALYDACARAGR